MTARWPYRRLLHLACLASIACLATSCGNSSSINGTIADPMITSVASCNGTGGLDGGIALTTAAGTIIARDQAASFAWQGGKCVIPFTFSGVPQLAGYGIEAPGLGSGPAWLTPEQAAQAVRLKVEPVTFNLVPS
jgi:hypothetical protein